MAEALFCFCGKPYDDTQFMIQCDWCKEWLHGSCIKLKEYQSYDIDKFFCHKCVPVSGPTVLKPRLNHHRHNYSDPDASHKPTQAGTKAFIDVLKSRSFLNAEEVILRLRGQQLTLPYLNSSGFTRPIFVEQKDGLDLNVPQDNFTVNDVENHVGSDRIIDVIDVTTQADLRMTLKDFVEYYSNPSKRLSLQQILNVISLEFSGSNLSALVEPPYIARKLCWASNVWPRDYPFERPEVQKYCLMGVKDSYTDFHIDFGGSSVWYHILKGEKIFYLVEPTPENMDLYLQWMLKPNHHELFFGDMADACYRLVLSKGNTLFIPTGWIHAVYTSQDSLVFGGNFLHNLNMELQLKVYNIEVASKAPFRFRFPSFQTIHWFAAERIVEDLRDMNSKGSRCQEQFIRGVRALAAALKSWTIEKDNGKGRSEPIPERILVPKLLKELSRELRHVEKNSNLSITQSPTATPLPLVKVEKTCPKRVRRKPQSRADFVDINEALSNFAAEEDRLSSKVEKMEEVRAVPFLPPTLRVSSQPYSIMPPRPNAVPLKLRLPKKGSDEDDERPLMIDEHKPKKPAKIGQNIQRGPIKLRLSVGGRTDYQFSETTEVAANLDIETGEDKLATANKSGIEVLLRASNMAVPGALEEIADPGRASPSTREAIVGMLTMSQGFNSPTSEHNGSLSASSLDKSNAPPVPAVSQRQRKGRRRLNSSLTDDYGDVVSKVHQDDEYIYPSLDASDDEGYDKESAKKKTGKVGRTRLDSGDESWNPRARVGPVVPKKDRPTRDGAKRPAVERVLEAAAQRRAFEPPPKRAYIRRSKSRSSISENPEAGASGPVVVPVSVGAPPTPTAPPPSLNKAESKANLAKKPKKGMATAKQRLGKILKIHKMVH